jgi:hypothetical protein
MVRQGHGRFVSRCTDSALERLCIAFPADVWMRRISGGTSGIQQTG